MTSREHITEAAPDPAPHRRGAEQAGWVSPAAVRHAEMHERLAVEDAVDRFRMPETRAELETFGQADRQRVFIEDHDRYERLMSERVA
ncbi:hypothetical protein ACFRH6_23090 [Streptomyces sp. NPDC056749]|uniref:hypothetical protein n=1 Tax=Streptomyces sp. NPDC056749 TaxID=3345936 RepID=UPI003697FFD0